MTGTFESPLTGEELPQVAVYYQHHWSARVLYQVEAAHEWVLTWTDGINVWYEEWNYSYEALARLAALAAAVEQDTFLTHREMDDPWARGDFRHAVQDFLARTIDPV